jgi:hypothetical protein
MLVPAHAAPVLVLCFKVDLVVLHPSGSMAQSLRIPLLTVFETPLAHTGIDVLVGCDVLSRCSFLHDGLNRTFTLSY